MRGEISRWRREVVEIPVVVPMRSGSGLDVGIRGDVSPNRWPQRRSVGGSMGKTSVWS
jgi:hypothetical protein